MGGSAPYGRKGDLLTISQKNTITFGFQMNELHFSSAVETKGKKGLFTPMRGKIVSYAGLKEKGRGSSNITKGGN